MKVASATSLRWVSETLKVREDFVGLYEVVLTRTETIYTAMNDVLLRLNLSISKLRGQCYNGAASMAGYKSGVATRVTADEPRAIYTHCYGHSLNLACCDTIKWCKLMKDALDTAHEIAKLIKRSPGREATFKSLQSEMAPETDLPGVCVLCPPDGLYGRIPSRAFLTTTRSSLSFGTSHWSMYEIPR